jgi:hypothetical protein
MTVDERFDKIEKEMKAMEKRIIEQIDMLHSLIVALNENTINKL